ncbi:hypothetical protein ACFU7Z_01240, partial [Kitasatospora sp. NPDC057518]
AITWRHGSRDHLTSDFIVLRVRLAGRRPRIEEDGTVPACRLPAQWPAHLPKPSHHWVSNLPTTTAQTKTSPDLTKHYSVQRP